LSTRTCPVAVALKSWPPHRGSLGVGFRFDRYRRDPRAGPTRGRGVEAVVDGGERRHHRTIVGWRNAVR
jgi:hypothetical protein